MTLSGTADQEADIFSNPLTLTQVHFVLTHFRKKSTLMLLISRDTTLIRSSHQGDHFAPQRTLGNVQRYLFVTARRGNSCYWHLLDMRPDILLNTHSVQISPPNKEFCGNPALKVQYSQVLL